MRSLVANHFTRASMAFLLFTFANNIVLYRFPSYVKFLKYLYFFTKYHILKKKNRRHRCHLEFLLKGTGRAVYPASQVLLRVCREPFPTSMPLVALLYHFFSGSSIANIKAIKRKKCSHKVLTAPDIGCILWSR